MIFHLTGSCAARSCCGGASAARQCWRLPGPSMRRPAPGARGARRKARRGAAALDAPQPQGAAGAGARSGSSSPAAAAAPGVPTSSPAGTSSPACRSGGAGGHLALERVLLALAIAAQLLAERLERGGLLRGRRRRRPLLVSHKMQDVVAHIRGLHRRVFWLICALWRNRLGAVRHCSDRNALQWTACRRRVVQSKSKLRRAC